MACLQSFLSHASGHFSRFMSGHAHIGVAPSLLGHAVWVTVFWVTPFGSRSFGSRLKFSKGLLGHGLLGHAVWVTVFWVRLFGSRSFGSQKNLASKADGKFK